MEGLADTNPALAQKLAFEQQLFAEGTTPESQASDHAAVEKRHAEILSSKSAGGKAEVDHAKAVAAAHLEQGPGFAGVEVPPQVASRLLFEEKLFAEGEADAATHDEVKRRHEEILAAKVAAAKAEVEHAKAVAAAHRAEHGSEPVVDLANVKE